MSVIDIQRNRPVQLLPGLVMARNSAVLAQAAVDIYYTKMGIAGIDASSIGEISGLATRTVQVYFVQVSQDKKNQSKTRTSDDR